MKYKVSIIGCGLMGQKRAKSLPSCCQLVAVHDLNNYLAENLAKKFQACHVFMDWQQLLADAESDIVIVSTTHVALSEIASIAIKQGKHVLIEKPAATHSDEIRSLINLQQKDQIIQVGFNHRYHPAISQAKQVVDSGALGPLYYIRAQYGHGGRLGYEKEWRMDKAQSGGGQLIDQGMHLIDLSRWFLGDFNHIEGRTHRYYWQAEVEDNAFLHLETSKHQTAFLHTSLTEWKNRFLFEIVGQKGKLDISGLGGSYGIERLTYYKMLPEMGPPETIIWEYPFADNSFQLEIELLIESIAAKKQLGPSLLDAQKALEIVEAVSR